VVETNLFNKITKLAKHLKYNSSLQKFNDVINWEIFRDNLEPMYKYKQVKDGVSTFR